MIGFQLLMTLLDTIFIAQLIAAVPLILFSLPLILAALLSGTLGQLDAQIVVALWIGTFVLAVILVPTLRRRRFLRWTAGIVCVSALCTYSFGVANRVVRQATEAAYQLEVERYTFRLDAPRSFDGIEFPAGSKVGLSIKPPHHLESGEVPVPTQVLGLDVIGRFGIHPPPSKDPSAPPKEVWSGTLATNATIRTVPCGPGGFQNTGSEGWSEKLAHPYYNPMYPIPMTRDGLGVGRPTKCGARWRAIFLLQAPSSVLVQWSTYGLGMTIDNRLSPANSPKRRRWQASPARLD